MNKNIEIQGFNVLSELNHNSEGNPHQQYVGNTRETMLKPTFDEELMNKKNNNYYKFAEFTLNKTNPTKVSLSIDVIDEYKNISFNTSNFDIQIVQINERENATLYFENNIFYKITGNDYSRIFLIETILNNDETKCELFLKLSSSKTNWNQSYVSIKYIDTNENTFKLIDKEYPIDVLPCGNLEVVNTISTKNLQSVVANKDDLYIKLIDFNFNFNGASMEYIINLTKGRVDKADNFGYCKLMIKGYSYGRNTPNAYIDIRVCVIESVNFNIENLFFIKNDKHIELFGKYNICEAYNISIENIIAHSNSYGREIKVKNWSPVEILPQGTKLKFLCKKLNMIFNEEDGNIYTSKINDYNLTLCNNDGVQIANMCKPVSFTESDASDLETLKIDFNNLLKALKSAKVLK